MSRVWEIRKDGETIISIPEAMKEIGYVTAMCFVNWTSKRHHWENGKRLITFVMY